MSIRITGNQTCEPNYTEQLNREKKNTNVSENNQDVHEKVIGSTDKVDREIKHLKNKKAQLEQQLKMVSENAEKAAEIQKKIMEVESELQQKDNDTYRKQHMETIDCYA